MNTLLSSDETRVLDRFVADLRKELGTGLHEVILFGSKARGDFSQESDLDLLVVVSALDHLLHRKINDLAYEAGLSAGINLSVKVMANATKTELEKSGAPFVENIKREGRSLWSQR